MTTIFDIPGTNPPNPFSQPIQALLTSSNIFSPSTPTPAETAANLATAIAKSPNPAHALWQLWDAFFIAVATNSTSHTPHLALLDALRAQPSTRPTNARVGSTTERQLHSYIKADGKFHWSELPRFSAQWRDVHDILKAWRDWDGVRASSTGENSASSTLSGSADEYFLRFCTFSAALLKKTQGKGEVHPVWVFLACRDVLERKQPLLRRPKAHRMPPEQVWVLDVRIAAAWMRDGGRVLWEMDHEELRRHWAAALDDKTELWPKEDGLTLERWRLWEERLHDLSVERSLDEETRVVVREAADVVRAIDATAVQTIESLPDAQA